MNISIPILVVNERGRGGPMYRGKPLFFSGPVETDANLNRLMNHLARKLSEVLKDLGNINRHESLAEYGFYPHLTQHRFDLTILLRRRTVKARYLFVTFKRHGKRIAFCPSLSDVWFDIGRNEILKERAEEVLTAFFREQEKEEEDGGNALRPESVALDGTAWITSLELDVHPPAVLPKEERTSFLMIGGGEKMHGSTELRRVGHCLDWLYPDELDRTLLRENEVQELLQLMASPDQRPILILGPRLVGKTSLLHECVYRRVAARRTPYRDRENVWLLAPQRLISGMSYVGQWENRLLAILKESKKRNHILYFDDLVGLFLAGLNASSSLSAAAVLKPYIERRDVRIVAEITSEGLRALQEQDRSFADLFHVLPMRAPEDRETMRILIGVQRTLEARHGCKFDLGALPAVIDLQRRYDRDASFPGKAARFLRQIAVKHAVTQRDETTPIPFLGRDEVLSEFQAQSGLSPLFLDPKGKLERGEIVDALSRKVIGQDHAAEAVADVIAVARAKLNDPDRPLGTFLFLGPTGVGKTQCAKTIAEYLFGDAERLVRFDMNEFVTPGSAARLVGTFRQPEGLLTAAVRRQPFAVVLLDEIEKADSEVFDLLLQVLGEGRLTDALGRTADFTNTIILLTSNLGVRESEKSMGFTAGDEQHRASIFAESARQFFRPEFFNRIDRIVPFGRLKRNDVRLIADRLVEEVLGREGFRQRRCMLQVDDAALEQIVESGYDPVLGARAMKRAVEKHLTQPIATRLAALPIDRFTVVAVYPGVGLVSGSAAPALAVQVQALEQVATSPRSVTTLNEAERLERIEAALDRAEAGFAPLRPTGPLGKTVTPEQSRYFALAEQAGQIREHLREIMALQDERESVGRLRGDFHASRRSPPLKKLLRYDNLVNSLQDMASAASLTEFVRELAQAATPPGEEEYDHLEQQIALLHAMATLESKPGVILWFRCGSPGNLFWKSLFLADQYKQALMQSLSLDVTDISPKRGEAPGERALVLRGPQAMRVAEMEAGTHLICPAHTSIVPLQIIALPMEVGDEPQTVLKSAQQKQQEWRVLMGRGEATSDTAPFAFGPVVRVITENGNVLDLRSGLMSPSPPTAAMLGGLLLATLPLPEEMTNAGAE